MTFDWRSLAGCYGKERHTAETARRAMNNMKKRGTIKHGAGRSGVQAYRCSYCGFLHVGTSPMGRTNG